MQTIIEKGNKILRKISDSVSPVEIKSAQIREIIKNMNSALDSQEDGVALAAPQIGVSKRIFVISKKVFEMMGKKDIDKEHLVYINPVILKSSKKKMKMEEGCLSARNLFGKVKRSGQVKIEAYDEYGRKFQRGGSGIIAQIFQHEVDHLNGILFTDTAEDLQIYDPKAHK